MKKKIPIPYKNPAVAGVVFNEDRTKILITKRADIPIWVFPGGGIDEGEAPDQAVIREILEETGIQTTIVRKVAEYIPVSTLAYFTHLYECQPVGGSLKTNEETKAVDFVSIRSLPKAFFHIHHDWLQDTLQNHPTLLQKPITQVTFPKLFAYSLRHPFRTLRALLSRFGMPVN